MSTFDKYAFKIKEGKRIRTSERLAEMKSLIRTMRGRLFPQLFVEAAERYNSGATLNFGEITVSQAVIAYRRKLLPRREFQGTRLVNGNLKLSAQMGKSLNDDCTRENSKSLRTHGAARRCFQKLM